MARGKQTCKILKEIRRQIAEANDIEFITSECQYQGVGRIAQIPMRPGILIICNTSLKKGMIWGLRFMLH